MWETLLWIVGILVVGSFLYGFAEGIPAARARVKAEKDHKALVHSIQTSVRDYLDLRKSLALPSVPFTITDDISNDLTESRFGGKAAWPKNIARPTARGNAPLCFLMQINLRDMPALDGFPNHGLLQFFFAADDLYGMTFPEGQSDGPTNKADILVMHHASTEDMEEWQLFGHRSETEMLDAPFLYDNWWTSGFQIVFDAARPMAPSIGDHRIWDKFWDLKKMFPSKKQFDNYADRWSKDDVHGPVIGGHPHFTQPDPRGHLPDYAVYSYSVLSIPTVSDKIMWGDCGTASFLIRPDALDKGRFDDILYNYDCF